MSDRATSYEGSHFAEWLETARGVPLMLRVVRQASRHAPAARSGEMTYLLAVPVDLEALVTRLRLEGRPDRSAQLPLVPTPALPSRDGRLEPG